MAIASYIKQDDQVLTDKELAALLKVSFYTVQRQARLGRLKGAYQIGSMWRFNREALVRQGILSR